MDLERLEQAFEFAIALADLLAVGVDQGQGPLHGEQVLVAPVALQGGGNLGFVGLDTPVPHRRQGTGIAFAADDRAHDGLAGDAHEVGNDVVQLHVHLGQGFLQVLHMPRLVGQQHVSVAPDGAQGADFVGRAEAPAQQAEAHQLLQPLAVEDIAFTAGHGLDVAGIHQVHLETGGIKHLVQGNPSVMAPRFTIPTGGRNTSAFATANGCQRQASSPRWAARATATTTL